MSLPGNDSIRSRPPLFFLSSSATFPSTLLKLLAFIWGSGRPVSVCSKLSVSGCQRGLRFHCCPVQMWISFPVLLSFLLTLQQLAFWLFHLSVAEPLLINNGQLIDFSPRSLHSPFIRDMISPGCFSPPFLSSRSTPWCSRFSPITSDTTSAWCTWTS